MVIEILMNINSNSGIVHDLGDISEYGEPNQTKWTLDESKFQITLDFSYSISDDVLYYTGPRGLTVDSIDWEYLCKLLQEKNIIINHNKSRFHEDEPNWYGTTYYTDVLTITLERTKKMQSDESIIDPKIPKK